MAKDIVSQYSKRVPFRAYIFFLLERHHIPLPRRKNDTFNTNEELWGYFIEMMYFRCVKKITYLPTNGYSVGDVISQFQNKTFTLTATYLNVFYPKMFKRDFSITTKGTASISGTNNSVVVSVELSDKFFTTQNGIGNVGTENTYSLNQLVSIAGNYGFMPGESPKVGSTIFHMNRYQSEITSINTGSGTVTAVTISTNSSDVWYLMNDTRNKLIAHMADYGNPHRVTLTQAEVYQGTNPLIINHGIYEGSQTSGNKLTTNTEVLSITNPINTNLGNHVSNRTNPHQVTLTQAEAQQGASDLIINHDIYKGSVTTNNRYVTYGDVNTLATSIANSIVTSAINTLKANNPSLV